jgi:hypothetical protein
LEPFGRATERPLVVDHTLRQAKAAGFGQGSVAVDHAGLSGSKDDDGRVHE